MATNKPMFHFFSLITHNLQTIVEHGGYLLLFSTTVFEGIPVVGQFIPGHTIVVISGFLIRLHLMNFIKVFVTIFVAAVIGDIIGFHLGRKYGFNFLARYGEYFFIKKEYVEKAKELVKSNPAKTIILGRFNPITRTLSPFIVGASGLHIRQFWIYDCISVILWSISSLAIGYIFGESYHAVSGLIGKYIFVAILLALLIVWMYRFINKQFHIFAKYELITLGANLFGLYLFFKTIQDALTDKVFLLELDLYMHDFFIIHAQQPLLIIMDIITNVLSPTSITLMSVAFVLYFIHKKKYYYTLITSLSIGGGYIFTLLIKNIVMRIRPEDSFIVQGGFSFPSGHAIAATIFFTLLIYFFIVRIRSMLWREVCIVISVLLALLVSFSRIYLGVHWLSDVVAGIGFGLFWTTLVILVAQYGRMIIKVLRRGRS